MNNCARCGRSLRLTLLHRVYGPKCWHRLRGPVLALERSGNPAAAKAADLLREGGLVRLRGHGGRVWRTVSSNGSQTYLTTREACTCKSGLFSILFDKMCYHRVAVIVMEEV